MLTPRKLPPITPAAAARFWSKVTKTETCWLWTGRPGEFGYGYFAVSIHTEFGRAHARFAAHRVAYLLGHGENPGDLYVLHSCDVQACVNPAHLRLGTRLDNERDKSARNRHPRGGRVPGVYLPRPEITLRRREAERHHAAKLTSAAAQSIRERYVAGEGTTQLAEEFGVTRQSLYCLLRGTTWKHAGGPRSEIRRMYGENVPTSKMTTDQVAQLRGLYESGWTLYDLAPRFGLAPQTVSNIVRGKTWKHVRPTDPAKVRRGFRMLTKEQVTKIRQRHAAGVSQRRLAKDYSVSPAAICLIVNRKTHTANSKPRLTLATLASALIPVV